MSKTFCFLVILVFLWGLQFWAWTLTIKTSPVTTDEYKAINNLLDKARTKNFAKCLKEFGFTLGLKKEYSKSFDAYGYNGFGRISCKGKQIIPSIISIDVKSPNLTMERLEEYTHNLIQSYEQPIVKTYPPIQ